MAPEDSQHINTRLAPAIKASFSNKCSEFGKKPSEMIREFIIAFNEDRLTIEPNEQQRNQQGLYK